MHYVNRREFLKCLSATPLLFSGDAWSAKKAVSELSADAVIVGSGPAGLAVADRLSAAGMQVIVVESGIGELDATYQTLARVESANAEHAQLYSQAGRRVAGGTTHVWGGICPRLRRPDIDSFSRYGYGADWPLAYHDLARHYCAAEHWLGVPAVSVKQQRTAGCASLALSPYVSSVEALEKAIRRRGYGGVGAAAMIVDRYGRYAPTNLVRDRLPVLFKRPNFHLLTGCTVRRILINRGGVARGVIGSSLKGDGVRVQAGVVVLAAGAVQNPRLLLLSETSCAPDGIGNAGGHVGRWFMDHPNYQFWVSPKQQWIKSRDRDAVVLHVYHWYERFKQNGLGAMLARIGAFDYVPFDGVSVASENQTFMLEAQMEQEPHYNNAVTLHPKKTDRFGDALPELTMHHSTVDKRTIQSAIEVLKPLSEYFGSTHSIRPLRITSHHLMGTTRMSADVYQGVVDANLKVHGVQNLYIAGSSVFPTGGAANPTLTLTALSLRLAEHLLALQRRRELKTR